MHTHLTRCFLARPKSNDKRNAILAAAAKIFSAQGLGAPTLAITKAAGVAEGTLFTYFKTKDVLTNALYREIKLDLAKAMMSDFPVKAGVRNRLKHVWDRYVDWGVNNTVQYRTLKHMEVWTGLTEASKSAGWAPFAEIEKLTEQAAAERILKNLPEKSVGAAIGALADMTMNLIRQRPREADLLRESGFDILWGGITRRK